MVEEKDAMVYKKQMCLNVSKSLNLVKAWNTLGPISAELITGSEYSPIPYIIDTNAYQIGHIFVQETSDVHCFCAAPQLKILGPVKNFVARRKTDAKWLEDELPTVKTPCEHPNYQVLLENSNKLMRLRTYDSFILEKEPEMLPQGNLTIKRVSHDELSHTDWFGLITGIFSSATWDIYLVRGQKERTFFLGDSSHTVFFKYEICKIDPAGTVVDTVTEKIECKWLPIADRDLNCLPVTKFVSQHKKTSKCNKC